MISMFYMSLNTHTHTHTHTHSHSHSHTHTHGHTHTHTHTHTRTSQYPSSPLTLQPFPNLPRKSQSLAPTESTKSELGKELNLTYYWSHRCQVWAPFGTPMSEMETLTVTSSSRHDLPEAWFNIAGPLPISLGLFFFF